MCRLVVCRSRLQALQGAVLRNQSLGLQQRLAGPGTRCSQFDAVSRCSKSPGPVLRQRMLSLEQAAPQHIHMSRGDVGARLAPAAQTRHSRLPTAGALQRSDHGLQHPATRITWPISVAGQRQPQRARDVRHRDIAQPGRALAGRIRRQHRPRNVRVQSMVLRCCAAEP